MTTQYMTPALSLDFISAVLDSRIGFARAANTATRLNSSGFVEVVNADIARFNYNPITLACRGLLVEESKSNDIDWSNDFSSGRWTWVSGATTVAAAAASPDGTTNAWKLTRPITGGGNGRIAKTLSLTSGTTYTFSVFAAPAEVAQIYFANDTRSASATFNLSTGAVVSTSGVVSFGSEQVKNGFWRYWITYTANTTASHGLRIQVQPNAGGTGTDGIYIYGAQHEIGTITSYVPTNGAAVIRNADVATITGTAFSSFWRSGPGSILVRALPSTVSGTRPLVQVDDATANEIIALRGNTTNPELYIVDGGSPQAQIDAGTIAANTAYRLAGAWATNSCAASLNGGASVLDGAATIPTVTQMRLGSDGTNYLNGHLQSLEYYDVRLSNADLQTVSSTAGYQSIVQPVLKNTIVSDIITELV